jgi:protein-arginine kinase activator protein McsA
MICHRCKTNKAEYQLVDKDRTFLYCATCADHVGKLISARELAGLPTGLVITPIPTPVATGQQPKGERRWRLKTR